MPTKIDWAQLLKLLPLIATTVNPALGPIAAALLAIGEEELARLQAANPHLTVDEIIAQGLADWNKTQADADELAGLGH